MIKKLVEVLRKTGINAEVTKTERFGPYTIVEMKDSKDHVAYGMSRQSGLDRDVPETGIFIAHGRAEKALLKKPNHEAIQHPFMA